MNSPKDMEGSKRLSPPNPRNRPNLCGAVSPHPNGVNWFSCMRRKDHVLKAGKYARQHMDSKCTPPKYWDPTPEEILAARDKVA